MTRSGIILQLTDRVWFAPPDPDPSRVRASIGIVVTGGESILLDAGNTPRHIRAVLADMHHLGLPPVGRIVYTHHHWDHVFGACAVDAPVIAHVRCREFLEDDARKPWSEAYLDQEVRSEPRRAGRASVLREGVDDWASFRIVLPTQVFEASHVLESGGLRLELEHVGGKHAADSVVIRIPGEGVMFLGDCFYPPPQYLGLEDKTFDLDMLESLLDPDYGRYVDGHNGAASLAELRQWLRTRR